MWWHGRVVSTVFGEVEVNIREVSGEEFGDGAFDMTIEKFSEVARGGVGSGIKEFDGVVIVLEVIVCGVVEVGVVVWVMWVDELVWV